MKLEDIASVTSGLTSEYRYEGEGQSYKIIRSISYNEPRIESKELKLGKRLFQNQILRPYDILVATKITVLHVNTELLGWGSIKIDPNEAYLASGSVLSVVRASSPQTAMLIKAFFDSRVGQDRLIEATKPVNLKVRGDQLMLHLTISGLRSIEIPPKDRWGDIVQSWTQIQAAKNKFEEVCRCSD